MTTTSKSFTAALALTLALAGGLTITSAFVADQPAAARDNGGGGGGGGNGGGAGGSDGNNPSIAFVNEFPQYDPPNIQIPPRRPRPEVQRHRVQRQLRANCFQIGATFDSRTGACQFHR